MIRRIIVVTTLLLLLVGAAACLTTSYAAPAAVGAVIFAQALRFVSAALDLPVWLTVALFLTLGPAFVSLAVRIAKKRRTMLAVGMVGLAVAAWGTYAARIHRNEIMETARALMLYYNCKFGGIVRVDPTAASWFDASGEPNLFYVSRGPHNWDFYRAFVGAHDPESGVPLLPVTASLRQTWTDARSAAEEERRNAEAARIDQLREAQARASVEGRARADQEARVARLVAEVESLKAKLERETLPPVSVPSSAADAAKAMPGSEARLDTAVWPLVQPTPTTAPTIQPPCPPRPRIYYVRRTYPVVYYYPPVPVVTYTYNVPMPSRRLIWVVNRFNPLQAAPGYFQGRRR